MGAEKKIELQDIEEDNLRSELETEKEKVADKSDSSQPTSAVSGLGFSSLDFMKSGLLRYLDGAAPVGPQPQQQQPQQQRYVHQYAVTEQPERHAPPSAKVHYGPPAPQQAMVGYLSNMPMQIYLVPQYYPDQSGPHARPQYQPQSQPQYEQPSLPRAGYQPAPEAIQNNYIDVPSVAYVAPPQKPYVPNYPQQGYTYVTYPTQPTAAATQATIAPVVAYQVPLIQFNPGVVSPPTIPKPYFNNNPEYTDSNTVDEVVTHENDQKQYTSQPELPYAAPEYPRNYNSRAPIREEYRHHGIPELPHPNPLLLKAQPPHLAHLPKALPMHRPYLKSYQGNALVPSSFTSRPHELYGPPPFKRRPNSLLDSYIPSSVQVEYLKRGLVKEPLHAYDAVASGRLPHPIPRQYERGFLPNQMYHTGAGGVTYGHYKRTPKSDRVPQK